MKTTFLATKTLNDRNSISCQKDIDWTKKINWKQKTSLKHLNCCISTDCNFKSRAYMRISPPQRICLKKSHFLPIMANLARVGISCRQRLVRPIANSFESRARPATKILCGQSFSREICLERSQKSKRSVKSGAQLRTLLAKTSQFLLKSTHISSKWDVISI